MTATPIEDAQVVYEPDPDSARDAQGHVAFGHGSHFCVGAQLARAEAAATLEAVVGQLRVERPTPPSWRHSFAT